MLPTFQRSATWLEISRFSIFRVLPFGLFLGASIETFMFYTGFWNVALRKASERRAFALSTTPPPPSSTSPSSSTTTTTTTTSSSSSTTTTTKL